MGDTSLEKKPGIKKKNKKTFLKHAIAANHAGTTSDQRNYTDTEKSKKKKQVFVDIINDCP